MTPIGVGGVLSDISQGEPMSGTDVGSSSMLHPATTIEFFEPEEALPSSRLSLAQRRRRERERGSASQDVTHATVGHIVPDGGSSSRLRLPTITELCEDEDEDEDAQQSARL